MSVKGENAELKSTEGTAPEPIFDRLTNALFAWCLYVTLFGGFGIHSGILRAFTASAIALTIVILVRIRCALPMLPRFSLSIVELFAKRPLVLGVALFLPLATSMILRPLFMQVMMEDAGAVNHAIFQYFATPPLHCDACFQGSFLGDHQAYTLVFGWLWVQVFHSPYAIPFFSVLVAGLTLGSVAWAFRKSISPERVSFVVLAIFAIRGFRAGYYFDFREDSLGAAFFAFALIAGRAKRWGWSTLFLALGGLSKETGAILAPTLVPWYFFQAKDMPWKRRIRMVTLVSVLAMAITVGILFFAIPAWTAGNGESNMLVGRLSYLGSTPAEILKGFLANPFRVLNPPGAGPSNHFRYFFHLIVPFLPFMLFAWDWAYFPGLVLAFGNLISLSPAQRSMNFHYDLLILPFFAFGLAASIAKGRNIFSGPRLALWILPFLIVSGMWPAAKLEDLWKYRGLAKERVFVREAAKWIPPAATTLVDIYIYPHLVDHRELRLLPGGDRGRRPIEDATYALVHENVVESSEEARRFFSGFDRRECSPSREICFWERRK